MDLDRLYEFTVIAEEGSFKSAAERLNVAPNVLSTRFRGFENSVGTTLIQRNAHKFELTQSGKTLLQKAPQMLDAYDRLRMSMDHIKGRTFKSLRIMLCGQLLPMELGPFLDRYCRQYPSMFLGMYDENRCMIREGLLSGEIDVAFAVGREGDFEDISGRVLLHRFPKIKVHVPLDHRLAKRQRRLCHSDLDSVYRQRTSKQIILSAIIRQQYDHADPDQHNSQILERNCNFHLYLLCFTVFANNYIITQAHKNINIFFRHLTYFPLS